MRILITGLTGFIGGHLVERLRLEQYSELHGVSLRGAWPAEWQHLDGSTALHTRDLAEPDGLDALLRELRPDWIFHLAGYANTGRSFREPEQAWSGNLRTTFNLYEAVARSGIRPRILFTS